MEMRVGLPSLGPAALKLVFDCLDSFLEGILDCSDSVRVVKELIVVLDGAAEEVDVFVNVEVVSLGTIVAPVLLAFAERVVVGAIAVGRLAECGEGVTDGVGGDHVCDAFDEGFEVSRFVAKSSRVQVS